MTRLTDDTPKYYKKKPDKIMAMRLTNANDQELRSWVGDKIFKGFHTHAEKPEENFAELEIQGGHAALMVGEFLVFNGAYYEIVDGDNFKRTYEEAR